MPDQADWLYTSLLVLRCQAGDAAAFEELVSRYQSGLRFFLRKMLADTHAASPIPWVHRPQIPSITPAYVAHYLSRVSLPFSHARHFAWAALRAAASVNP